jgi:hypothetical protein
VNVMAIAFDGTTLAARADKRGGQRCSVGFTEYNSTGNTRIAVASYGTPRIVAAVDEWLHDWLGFNDVTTQELPTYNAGAEQYSAVVVYDKTVFSVVPDTDYTWKPLISRLVWKEARGPLLMRIRPHNDYVDTVVTDNLTPADLAMGAAAMLEQYVGGGPHTGPVRSVDTTEIFKGFGWRAQREQEFYST